MACDVSPVAMFYSCPPCGVAIVLTNVYFAFCIAYSGFPDVVIIFIIASNMTIIQHHFMPMHVMAMEKFMIPVEICNEEPVCGGSTHDPPTVPPHF